MSSANRVPEHLVLLALPWVWPSGCDPSHHHPISPPKLGISTALQSGVLSALQGGQGRGMGTAGIPGMLFLGAREGQHLGSPARLSQAHLLPSRIRVGLFGVPPVLPFLGAELPGLRGAPLRPALALLVPGLGGSLHSCSASSPAAVGQARRRWLPRLGWSSPLCSCRST